ncbi:hypothetical protein P3G55_01700 [Leptospira sp. 96542]|nr:hypothetical protein [Leptospira sp. 96542]
MSFQVLKLVHITGIFLLFFSLGGIALYTLNGGKKSDNKYRLLAAITHGLGLILLIGAGFPMLKHVGVSHAALPGWVWVKLVIWLMFGGLLALVSKKEQFAKILWFGFPILGITAGYLAIFKPF